MPKYLTIVNYGYGQEEEVIEAENQEKANKIAYQTWLEGAENNGEYEAKPFTKEVAEEYGLEEQFNADE